MPVRAAVLTEHGHRDLEGAVQPARRPAVLRQHRPGGRARHAPRAGGVRLRRAGAGEGRHGDAGSSTARRSERRGGRDGGHYLLGRRHLRRRQGGRRPGGGGLPVPNVFTGEINWVEIDIGDAAVDGDHRLEPDELLRVAMARPMTRLSPPHSTGLESVLSRAGTFLTGRFRRCRGHAGRCSAGRLTASDVIRLALTSSAAACCRASTAATTHVEERRRSKSPVRCPRRISRSKRSATRA
jgi:hypothetical protein